MNVSRSREQLWTATAEAARESKEIRFRSDPSPCPGDTFVFHETAEFPVEWTVVERDPNDPRRLLVLPLDDYPQSGSHDLVLQLDQPGRVANIRCDVGAWLDASRFQIGLRTGVLPAESIGEIRDKRTKISRGDIAASLLEEKVDGDPEYRRWKDETLEAARAALKAETSRAPVPLPNRRSWRSARRLLAAAAGIVLVVGLAWSVRHIRHLRDQILAKNGQVAAVASELEQVRSELAASDREAEASQRLVAKLRRQLAESPVQGVLANLPVSFLRGGPTRGEYPVPVPEGAPRFALVIEVVSAEPYDRYRLEILDKGKGGVLVWASDQLRLGPDSVLSLSLPSSLFAPGQHELLLYGVQDDGSTIRLRERYLMKVFRTAQ